MSTKYKAYLFEREQVITSNLTMDIKSDVAMEPLFMMGLNDNGYKPSLREVKKYDHLQADQGWQRGTNKKQLKACQAIKAPWIKTNIPW